MKYARTRQHAAATAIQAAYRGYAVRRTKPLKHLRIIKSVRTELQRLEYQLASDPRLLESLRKDPAERLKWSEGAMALLLQLDSMQGVHPVVRDNRKTLTKEVISYQEYLDSTGKAGFGARDQAKHGAAPPVPPAKPHMPYIHNAGQAPPQSVPVYGQQSYPTANPPSYSPTNVSYSQWPQGYNPQSHVPYVSTGSGRTQPVGSVPPKTAYPGPIPPPTQYSGQSENFYPTAGNSRYEYDARFPPGTEPDVIDLFRRADVDGSGAIDTLELQRILSLKFFNFSRKTVRLMLHLFADDTTSSSKLGPEAFAKLWKELRKWQRVFKTFDHDNSGSIDLPELREAMLSLGIGVTPQVLQLLVFNYDRSGMNSSIAFGDFIECGLIVKGLTEKFILHDPDRKSVV